MICHHQCYEHISGAANIVGEKLRKWFCAAGNIFEKVQNGQR